MAEGPRTARPQPASGDDLQRWLERKIGAPGQGISAIERLDLPIGPAVVLERVDRAGTPTARRIRAYAIRTTLGLAFLLIDGPEGAWTGHEADVALIPWLMTVAPGRGP
jgi:hypothetical protein